MISQLRRSALRGLLSPAILVPGLVVTSLIVMTGAIALLDVPSFDEMEMMHVFYLLWNGKTLWVDFFEHHSPLYFWLNSHLLSPGWVLFALEARAFHFLIFAATSFLFALTCERLFAIEHHIRMPFRLLCLIAFVSFSWPTDIGAVRPDTYAFFVLMCGTVLACPAKRPTKLILLRSVAIGACFAAAISFSPRTLPFVAGFLALTLVLQRKWSDRFAHASALAGGVLLVVVADFLIAPPEGYYRWLVEFNGHLRPLRRDIPGAATSCVGIAVLAVLSIGLASIRMLRGRRREPSHETIMLLATAIVVILSWIYLFADNSWGRQSFGGVAVATAFLVCCLISIPLRVFGFSFPSSLASPPALTTGDNAAAPPANDISLRRNIVVCILVLFLWKLLRSPAFAFLRHLQSPLQGLPTPWSEIWGAALRWPGWIAIIVCGTILSLLYRCAELGKSRPQSRFAQFATDVFGILLGALLAFLGSAALDVISITVGPLWLRPVILFPLSAVIIIPMGRLLPKFQIAILAILIVMMSVQLATWGSSAAWGWLLGIAAVLISTTKAARDLSAGLTDFLIIKAGPGIRALGYNNVISCSVVFVLTCTLVAMPNLENTIYAGFTHQIWKNNLSFFHRAWNGAPVSRIDQLPPLTQTSNLGEWTLINKKFCAALKGKTVAMIPNLHPICAADASFYWYGGYHIVAMQKDHVATDLMPSFDIVNDLIERKPALIDIVFLDWNIKSELSKQALLREYRPVKLPTGETWAFARGLHPESALDLK